MERNIDLAWTLRESIARSYETAFAASPDRAALAHQRADEAVELLLSELKSVGFTTEDMRGAGLDEEKLRRVISWCAFDYSRQREDSSYETVGKDTFVAPFVSQLLATDSDFMAATADLETSIIAMRVHRSRAGLGPLKDDPTQEFIKDYMAVSDSPLLPGEGV